MCATLSIMLVIFYDNHGLYYKRITIINDAYIVVNE